MIKIVFDWSDFLAWYAAIISTVVLIVHLLRYWHEYSHRVVVKFFVSGRALFFGPGKTGPWETTLTLQLVNHSATEKYISSINLEVKGGQRFSLIKMDPPITFPINLKHGQPYEVVYTDPNSVKQTVLSLEKTKVRALILDSLGNEYFSEWINVNDIMGPIMK